MGKSRKEIPDDGAHGGLDEQLLLVEDEKVVAGAADAAQHRVLL